MSLTDSGWMREAREELAAATRSFKALIDRVAGGEHMPEGSLPWGDSRFQAMVCIALRKGKEFEKDAQKLAVVKEVFGGKP